MSHREAPPPPHDPAERVLITRIDGWHVRDFSLVDVRSAYFALRGFAHLQLWHPDARVSVLTPSRLTDGKFEVFPIGGWKRRTAEWSELRELIAATHRIDVPRLTSVRAVERWFVRLTEIEVETLRSGR